METGLMIYKPLPSEVLRTLAQQSLGTSSTKGGEEFVASYIQSRTTEEIDDLSSQLKRVNMHFIE